MGCRPLTEACASTFCLSPVIPVLSLGFATHAVWENKIKENSNAEQLILFIFSLKGLQQHFALYHQLLFNIVNLLVQNGSILSKHFISSVSGICQLVQSFDWIYHMPRRMLFYFRNSVKVGPLDALS
jgi:hypothetical protein